MNHKHDWYTYHTSNKPRIEKCPCGWVRMWNYEEGNADWLYYNLNEFDPNGMIEERFLERTL